MQSAKYYMDKVSSTLPPQMIPQKKKNKKFIEETLDILESIGIKQFKENLKFKDFYKMVEGKLVYSDYLDIPAQLREVQKVREDFHKKVMLAVESCEPYVQLDFPQNHWPEHKTKITEELLDIFGELTIVTINRKPKLDSKTSQTITEKDEF